jgi:phospholipid-translocating ATPase
MYPPPVASSSRPHSYNTEASNAQTHDEDEDDDAFDPFAIDPNYRLKTVRTAHSVLAESIRSERDAEDRKRHKKRMFSGLRRKGSSMTVVKESLRSKRSESDATTDASENGMSRRGSKAFPAKSDSPSLEEKQEKGKEKAKSTLPRREIFINIPLPTHLLTTKGEPIVRYVRNKVRTSKYTLITFIPKNLFEQFRRVANIFFLAMVILQVFPIFGATNAQIGMLPLLAILGMTAIKDGIEDWRRAKLDNEVNNSATTKLGGGWRNVNQPSDPRSFLEKLFGLGPGEHICPRSPISQSSLTRSSTGQGLEGSEETAAK